MEMPGRTLKVFGTKHQKASQLQQEESCKTKKFYLLYPSKAAASNSNMT
jgi:hypothetical protein